MNEDLALDSFESLRRKFGITKRELLNHHRKELEGSLRFRVDIYPDGVVMPSKEQPEGGERA